ncbi:MAG: hypothetical protein IPO26_20030 [Saprospiraceae bacterium]|nr:hypothetical protein [Saprospiraceae bacterium]
MEPINDRPVCPMGVGGTHRQVVGFEGAPQVTTLSFQLPFYQGLNTSSVGGAYLERDQIGPFENYALPLLMHINSNQITKTGVYDEMSLGFFH